MVRCFIGIFVPEEIKKAVVKLQDELKKLPMDCKLVEEENLHISISFLGEVDESRAEEISAKLDDICKNYRKFEVALSGIKLIPSENYIRVIAIDTENEMLKEISRLVKQKIGGDVKPAHLTLCRVRNVERKEVVVHETAKYSERNFGSFFVEKVELIKSELKQSGPIYATIHESKLVG